MRYAILFAEIALLQFLLFFAQNLLAQNEFHHLLGTPKTEQGVVVLPTPDGGWLIGGNTDGQGAGNTDIYLRKTNHCFLPEWEKTLGGELAEKIAAICPTDDKQFVVAGSTRSHKDAKWHLFLTKINLEGQISWRRTFADLDYDLIATDVKASKDQGYYVLARVNHTAHFYLLKINYHGQKVWARLFTRQSTDQAFSMTVTDQNDCVIAGTTRSFRDKINDVFVMKVSQEGQTLWGYAYGGPHDDIAYKIVELDTGYLVLGGARSFHQYNQKPFALFINQKGEYVWFKTYKTDKSESIRDVIVSPDKKIFTFLIESFDTREQTTVSFLQIDNLGTHLWKKSYQPKAKDNLFAGKIHAYNDSTFVFCGAYEDRFFPGNMDIFLALLPLSAVCSENFTPQTTQTQHARPIIFEPFWNNSERVTEDKSLGQFAKADLLERQIYPTQSQKKQLLHINSTLRDTVFCDKTIILDAGQGFERYQWQDGSRSQFFFAEKPGVYWVKTVKNCQSFTDSVRVFDCDYPITSPQPLVVYNEKIPANPTFQTLKVGQKMILDKLVFQKGSAQLDSLAYDALDQLYLFLKQNPQKTIKLMGHTDNVGRKDLNLQLSKERVQKVKSYLVGRGIASDRIEIAFFGGLQPIADNKTEDGRKANRRVELVLLNE